MAYNCCKETLPKTITKDKTICYCNEITKKEIIQTIKKTGLKTIPEIKNYLRDEIISNCEELNPTGKCCHESFNAVIQKVIENP
ncbi:MAG: (2Fe-2S)-binding protein [Promethearchaeota archaeon]|jgi:bacterioferritin-associated ferredoxin